MNDHNFLVFFFNTGNSELIIADTHILVYLFNKIFLVFFFINEINKHINRFAYIQHHLILSSTHY